MNNLNSSIHERNQNDRDLEQLEQQLIQEVDVDLFEEPKSFRTLHRVIDILGAQLLDDDPLRRSTNSSAGHEQAYENLTTKNPAYLALLKQKSVVESAIEHMSINHCSELNGSVASVGNVARQFSDAVYRVRNLRKQVKDIKRQLHHSDVGTSNQHLQGKTNHIHATDSSGLGGAGNYSLRELWLKKLESEAVLTLLSKLEIIREAPTAFDSLIMPHGGQCRIGAAVTLLSNAIHTMFSDDVSQIQALTKIMDQLMTRKQKAEEIVWDTLHDIIYLRTGNKINPTLNTASINASNHPYHGRKDISAVPGGSLYKNKNNDNDGMHQIFFGTDEFHELEDDEASATSAFSGFSHPSISDSQSSHSNNPNKPYVTGRMIPQSVMETELDLEEDELLCLEEEQHDGQGMLAPTSVKGSPPRYSDPTQALRILVETIAKLGRLDDIERFLNESLEREIRTLAEQEQQKTMTLLERRKHKRMRNREFRDTATTTLPYEFKHHLRSLLHSFGNVMLRLSHLAQILRAQIVSYALLLFLYFDCIASCCYFNILLTSDHGYNAKDIRPTNNHSFLFSPFYCPSWSYQSCLQHHAT